MELKDFKPTQTVEVVELEHGDARAGLRIGYLGEVLSNSNPRHVGMVQVYWFMLDKYTFMLPSQLKVSKVV
jgi:hypothetical protein